MLFPLFTPAQPLPRLPAHTNVANIARAALTACVARAIHPSQLHLQKPCQSLFPRISHPASPHPLIWPIRVLRALQAAAAPLPFASAFGCLVPPCLRCSIPPSSSSPPRARRGSLPLQAAIQLVRDAVASIVVLGTEFQPRLCGGYLQARSCSPCRSFLCEGGMKYYSRFKRP